jgi:hypothetical protein
VTHAELRARLPGYAEGTLAESEAGEIRAHLATGCEECMRSVFMRPVGLPRPAPGRLGPPWAILAATIAGSVFGLAIGVAWMASTSRWPAGVSDDRVGSEVQALRERVDALGAAATATMARLEARLESVVVARPTTAVTIAPPDATVGANGSADEDAPVPGWLRELLQSDGVRVVALEASPDAPGARGFAVWSPVRGVVVVSAEALPPGVATYRVRVTLTDQATVWVGDSEQDANGMLVISVGLPEGDERRVQAVDLYRDPPGSPVLSGRW